MPTLRMLTAAAALAVVASVPSGSPAWSQANLKPDETPRLPTASPDVLVQEDRQFIAAAKALNTVEQDLVALAAERGGEAVRRVAGDIAEDHRRLAQELGTVEAELGVSPEPDVRVPDGGGPGGAASAVTAPRHAPGGVGPQAVETLRTMQGGEDFDRRWVAEQIAIHDRLADLYQTTASQTQRDVLAIFAITGLVTITENRQELRVLARDFGIEVDPEGQPPQYGDR